MNATGWEKQPVESELIFEGLASYDNYKTLPSGTGSKLYMGGVEYDRHTWSSFLGARMDYVAEILPLVLLDTPTKSYPWATRKPPPATSCPAWEFRRLVSA
jgi:hypothetical protein